MNNEYSTFSKYIDKKIEAISEISRLRVKKAKLASDYWSVERKIKGRKKELRDKLLTKTRRKKLKKQYKLEKSLLILKESK